MRVQLPPLAPNDMISVAMQEKDETTRILEIVVPQEEVDKGFNQVTARMQQKTALPGFRKGKVPRDIVEKKFAAEIREEVLTALFNDSYQQALTQTRCVPINQPRLEKVELHQGRPLSYQVVVEVLPKLKLGSYQGLKIKKNKIAVLESAITDVLERLRHQSALLEPVENRPAQNGDLATIDFAGKKQGQFVPGAKAENQLIELGAGQTIPDFEKNILGMQVKESRTFTTVFPQEYPVQDLAGQEIEFTVALKLLQQKRLAELNDDFAKQMGPFETLADLQARIRQDLTTEQERQNRVLLVDQIMKELSKQTQVKVPEVLVERSLTSLYRDYESRLAQQPPDKNQAGLTREEFCSKNREQVEHELKARLALREIALQEKIEATNEDVEKEIGRLARSTRQNPEVIRHWLTANKGWEDLHDRLRDEKTQDFIISQARISEK
ncbi:trigger factor [candidate division FCPU426 bacterium]|nr:trigger factor [candidate division FCPU426 bacterium]